MELLHQAVWWACVVGVLSGKTWLRHCEQHTPTPTQGRVEGQVPAWVEGKLTRVGGGIRHVGNTSYHHMFDPLALLHRVTIKDGQATYTSRYLESNTYLANMAAERIAVSGFGTVAYPDPCATLFSGMAAIMSMPAMTDNCLVNVLQVKDEMMVMTETDKIRLLMPESLDTREDFIDITQYIAVQRASAHPHVWSDGTVYNLAASVTSRGPGYSIISLPQGQYEGAKIEATIPARWRFNPSYFHSFGITENYFILVETPFVTNVWEMMSSPFRGVPFESAMKWYPQEKTRFRVIDRRTGEEHQTTFLADAFFVFHHTNAYEKDGKLVVDLSLIKSGQVIKSLYFSNLRKDPSDPTRKMFDSITTRFVLPMEELTNMPFDEELLQDFEDATLEGKDGRASAKKIDTNTIRLEGLTINPNFFEMPRINYKYNGKPYHYAYGVGSDNMDFTSLIKVDMRTGETKSWSDDQYVVSEPVFVESRDAGGEDNGVVMSVLLHRANPRLISLLVLDAATFDQLARVEFTTRGTATQTFHGQFVHDHDDIHGY